MRTRPPHEASWQLADDVSPEEWSRLRADVRRRSRRRAGLMLLAMPAVLAGEIIHLVRYWGDFAGIPFVGNLAVACIGFAVLVIGGMFVGAALQGLRSETLIMRGQVLRKLGGEAAGKPLATVFAYAFEMVLVLDVEECIRLGPSGRVDRADEWRTCRNVPAARRVHKNVRPGDVVVLACGPGGRAFAFLSEFGRR